MYYLVYSFGTKSIFKIYYTYLTSYDATWPRKWSSHQIWQRNLQSNSSYHGLDFRFPFFFFVSVCGGGEGGALKFAPNCGGCCKFKTNFLIKLLCPRVNSNYTAPHRHLASLSICQRYFIFCLFFFLFYLLVFFPCLFFCGHRHPIHRLIIKRPKEQLVSFAVSPSLCAFCLLRLLRFSNRNDFA